jgi:hypothetical protein
MKKLLFLLPLILLSCEVVDIEEYDDINEEPHTEFILTQNQLTIPNGLGVGSTIGNPQLNFNLNRTDGEYFVFGSKGYESVVLKRENSIWNSFLVEDTRIHGGRNYRIVDENTFVISGTGETDYIPYSDWVDHIYIGTLNSNTLEYTQVSTNKGYYHGIAVGDLTNDGLIDIVTNGGKFFIQNQNNIFTEYDYLNAPPNNPIIDTQRMSELGNPIEPKIYDLFNGGRPELIYGFVDDNDINKGEVLIYEYSSQTNKYELVFEISSDVNFGKQVNSFQISDLNLDGINDIVIMRWGYTYDDSSMMIDVWLGNSDKTFSKSYEKFWPNDLFKSAQFKLYDVNSDGYDDIVFIPFGVNINSEWRYHTADEINNGIYLNKLVMINNGTGQFEYIDKDIIVKDIGDIEYFIPFLRNGNLVFLGTKGEVNNNNFEFNLFDIEINTNTWIW